MKIVVTRFLVAVSLAASAAVLGCSAEEGRKVMTVSGSGGVVADVTQEIYLDPFAAEHNLDIRRVATESARMAQLESMVRAGKPIWDVMEVSGNNYPVGVEKELFEPIDYSIVDPERKLPEMARQEFGVAASTWAHGLAVRTDKLPDGKRMTSWEDFWDVETFPGPRALSSLPRDNLEFALLADGVHKDDLYEVLSTDGGIERAIAKLDEIRPHVSKWWSSGAQSVQLLSDGEAWYAAAYNGRIESLADSGVPVEFIWDGAAMHLSYVSIPRGAANLREAYLYAHFRAADAERMRAFVSILPYPGFAPGLFDGLEESVAAQLPSNPSNAQRMFVVDEGFWAENLEEIHEAWDEWMLL